MVDDHMPLSGGYSSVLIQFYGEYAEGASQPYPFYLYQVIGLIAPWVGESGKAAYIRCLTDNGEATKKLHIGTATKDPIQMALTHLKDRHKNLRSC